MKTNIFYVYAYLRIDGTPYYIGKGHAKRIHNRHENIKVPPIERRVFLKENLEEQEAYDYEMELIREYGRKNFDEGGILWNVAVGGPYAATKLYTKEEKKEANRKAALKSYHKAKEDPDRWGRIQERDRNRDRTEYLSRPEVKKRIKEYSNKWRENLRASAERYYLQLRADPERYEEYKRKRYEQRAKKVAEIKSDPERYEEYLRKQREQKAKQRERINADPELRKAYLAKKREDNRKRYSTPEGKKKKYEQKKKYMQEMKKDPERYAAHLEKQREYKRKRRMMGIPWNQC